MIRQLTATQQRRPPTVAISSAAVIASLPLPTKGTFPLTQRYQINSFFLFFLFFSFILTCDIIVVIVFCNVYSCVDHLVFWTFIFNLKIEFRSSPLEFRSSPLEFHHQIAVQFDLMMCNFLRNCHNQNNGLHLGETYKKTIDCFILYAGFLLGLHNIKITITVCISSWHTRLFNYSRVQHITCTFIWMYKNSKMFVIESVVINGQVFRCQDTVVVFSTENLLSVWRF